MSNRIGAVPASFVEGIRPGDLLQMGSRVHQVAAVEATVLRLVDGTRVAKTAE